MMSKEQFTNFCREHLAWLEQGDIEVLWQAYTTSPKELGGCYDPLPGDFDPCPGDSISF